MFWRHAKRRNRRLSVARAAARANPKRTRGRAKKTEVLTSTGSPNQKSRIQIQGDLQWGVAHRSRWRLARRGRRVPILVSLSSPCRSFGWQRWLPSRLPCSDCEVKCKRRKCRESMAMRWSDAVASPSASSRWWSRFHIGAALSAAQTAVGLNV